MVGYQYDDVDLSWKKSKLATFLYIASPCKCKMAKLDCGRFQIKINEKGDCECFFSKKTNAGISIDADRIIRLVTISFFVEIIYKLWKYKSVTKIERLIQITTKQSSKLYFRESFVTQQIKVKVTEISIIFNVTSILN